jgi:membrane protease YdiL (CAAX protease family)
MKAEPQDRGGRLIWVIWVGAPSVAWLAHALLGLSMVPTDMPSWIWMFGAAPLLEELVFRPLLQRELQERLPAWLACAKGMKALADSSAHLANLIAGLAFIAAHAPQQGWSAVWWIVPSLAIGETWRRQQKLWPCVFMHIWFNASLFAASWVAAR